MVICARFVSPFGRPLTAAMLVGMLIVTLPQVGRADDSEQLVGIRGIVVDEADNPLAGVLVEAPTPMPRPAVRTDKQGRFVLPLDAFRAKYFTLIARHPTDELAGYYQYSQQSEDEPRPEPRVVVKAVRRLKTIVEDAAGQPVAGAKVYAIASYSKVAASESDASGAATLLLPSDAPLASIVAYHESFGIDYSRFHAPGEKTGEPYSRSSDFGGPVSLTLAETRPIEVRTIDELGKRLPGVKAYLNSIELPQRGGGVNVEAIPEFFATTDANGTARLGWVPKAQVGLRRISVLLREYVPVEEPIFDPAKPAEEFTVALVPLVPLRGKVLLPDGQPAAKAQVQISGSGYSHRHFSKVVTTDERGEFATKVEPDCFYALRASRDQLVAPTFYRTVLSGRDVPPIPLQLAQGTRVYGQLRQGKENKELVGQFVSVQQSEWKAHNDLPEGEQLPNPKQSTISIIALVEQQTRTDGQGRYEFFLAPGSYYMLSHGAGLVDPVKFEVTEERELKVDLHSQGPDRMPLRARVTLKSDPDRPVVGAKVWGVPLDQRGPFLGGITGKDGTFETNRAVGEIYAHAKSEDGLLAAIRLLPAGTRVETFLLEPTATVHGRLIDGATGAGQPGRQIDFGYQVKYPGGTYSSQFGGSATTGPDGSFVLTGLTPGWKFDLQLVLEMKDGVPNSWRNIASVTPKDAAPIDLGEVKLPEIPKPVTLDDLIERAMGFPEPLGDRRKLKLRDAELAEQQLLVVVAEKGGSIARQFYDVYYDLDNKRKDASLREQLANYTVLGVDSGSEKDAKERRAMLEQWKVTAPGAGEGLLLVVSADGKLVAQRNADELTDAGTLNVDRLEEFLASVVPELPDAAILLAEALRRAERENKRVFVQQSGAFCGPCVLMSRLMDAYHEQLDKDYVYVKLDTRFKNGPETIKRIRPDAAGGIPWMVILDPEAKPLITSDGPDGNIGYPGEPDSVTHFEKMLRETRQHMSDDDLSKIVDELRAKAK